MKVKGQKQKQKTNTSTETSNLFNYQPVILVSLTLFISQTFLFLNIVDKSYYFKVLPKTEDCSACPINTSAQAY